nr:unnamed protein product [Callosobruchus analis]
MKMKDCSEPSQREALQIEYSNHIEDSQLRYKMKAAEKKCAKVKNKKLWTFNLTIHDSTVNKTFCMMWDERVAGRGGYEVAYAILKWIQLSGLDPQIEELTIWSDNCPSQNWNLMMLMCYFHIFNICQNLRIMNIYLGGIPDSDHALIEKQVKRTAAFQIATPWDWQQLVKMTSPKFSVIDIGIKDFLDMKSLYNDNNSAFIKDRKSESGNVLRISEAVHLRVKRDRPGHLFFKREVFCTIVKGEKNCLVCHSRGQQNISIHIIVVRMSLG